ncbi:uncharacterized protein LOC119375911 [Rhipicephalus sanguineus]|uniref:uncharacterized protein LOC119375911 n=1 Tax=Rhipicephalus sanguineus TaxID=34632 RepID=UPI0020C1F41E|nr:uncharacterized protein LOC119375911 [Rhipicephalus sanguineus]
MSQKVWSYLNSTTATVRQAHRGWAFKEEGYVKNLMINLNTSDPVVGLVRAACLPSMKTGAYVVTAWYNKASGDIAGAYCTCVAGLSQSCQHVAGLLLSVADKTAKELQSCTDVPCKWIVPAEAKKPAPRLPLHDISFQRHVVNKPGHIKKQREYDPCPYVQPSQDEISELKASLSACCPSLQVLRYLCPHDKVAQSEGKPNNQVLSDDVDLWSKEAQVIISAHFQAIEPLDERNREEICRKTIGQAANKLWYSERTGRITASMFKRVCRCVKPEGLLKTLLYPSDRAVSEAIMYGRMHEEDAVEAYATLLRCRDVELQVKETGLHVHKQYPFLAASPDRIIILDGEEGLLEVKCPFSKKGLSADEACKDKNFCCTLKDGQVHLKKDHAYHYQVQGQMAITGHKWCDFVIWTESEDPNETNHINVERIFFDPSFWENEVLPGLLHFMEKAVIPERLTGRVKRLGKLYTTGQYVSYKKIKDGFYVCSQKDRLVLSFRKLK